MIDGLKPYPKHKDSGVPWLGEIPEHWGVRRLRSIANIKTGCRDTADRVDDGQYPFFVRSQTVERINTWSYDGEAVLTAGDGVGVARVFHYVNGKFDYHQRVYKFSNFREILGKFFFEYFRATLKFEALAGNAKSTVDSLRQPMLQNFAVVLPPLPEQTAIVRFLDWADHRIRRVIRAREKRIKLLKEYKQALINQAVTGKIDVRTGKPYPKYKDSGVEWLGKVPEHWEVVHLARCLVRIDQGWSPIAAEGELAADQWAVLTLSAVRKGEFDPKAIKPIPVNASTRYGIEISDGDLLITRSNTRDLVGDVCIVRGARPKTVLCDLIYRLITRKDILNARFLMHLLLSQFGREQIERDARGSSGTMPKISQQRMRSWLLTLPSLPEQTAIVKFLDKQTQKIDSAISTTRREIELLKEFRTRLIADVVTGKLDVREAAAKLSDKSPGEKTLEDDEPESAIGDSVANVEHVDRTQEKINGG